ncbi:conserved Plasmodium protein, unknown function [Plasmodium vinckei vinckei]|uniref:Uncharacterized protein n=1 Tax=Plasmodium vinckei vinckei TaxID=54757 RepID=A0A449BWM7_PLAVN|nr:conserved Plasmodium protein, unknown function [Plasmodium vinckei vinckei]VEV57772.1 conserved Plasmodium protein, unknown function [Plasmodium vinckei vinckei]
MTEEDKLNLIKDYLNNLNMTSQNLCNINYYNSLPKFKKISDINDNPILNCLRTNYNERKSHTANENEQFKSIDFEGYSTNIESESSISLDQTHDYVNQLSEGEEDGNRAKKKEKKKFHTNSEKPKKKKIIFSFKKKKETKNRNPSYIRNVEMISDRNDDPFVGSLNRIEKPLILNQINTTKFCNKNPSISCANVDYNKRGEERKGNEMHILNDINHVSNYDGNKYNKNNSKSSIYSQISESQHSDVNSAIRNSKKNKKKEKKKKTILNDTYSKNIKENDDIEELNNMENNFCRVAQKNEENKYIRPNKLEIKDNHIKGINIKKMTNRQNATFSNDHEKELFQYLIKEANKEIEKIIIKIEQKYKNEIAYKTNNIKKEYDEKIKALTKNDTILLKNHNNKKKIKNLENANYMLLKEIEKLKKYNKEANDNNFQKCESINKNELNTKKLKDKIQTMNKLIEEYEKKINMLNDDVNTNYEKYFYFQNKCGNNEKVIQQNEDEMINLKKKLEISGKSKNVVELELKQLQDKNIKVERDNNNLREELNKAKTNVSTLKEQNNEEQRNNEYLISCYKVEEKKLKEDLENYKIKYAISENNQYSKTLEQKLKNLEITLKDMENEKSIYERTCLKYEKAEKILKAEIKDLKNELYECKNKLHQVNKPTSPTIQTIMFNANLEYGLPQEKENEHNMDKVQEREEFKSDEIPRESDITEKINSIEKQLILLKLEKSTKESELIRCPKYGKRSDEIKKKAFLEQKLSYINDKINILNKNLKLIKNKK